MTKARLRLLQVEDSVGDAELVVAQLRHVGFDVHATRVDSQNALEEALGSGTWDIIISDFNLPSYCPQAALQLLRDKDMDIPFIVVSGCIGEETAVAVMKAGASDYVMKDNLVRLVPVVERELREAALRREHRVALRQMQTNEKLLHDITSTLGEGIFAIDRDGRLMFMNPEAENLLGWRENELIGRDMHEAIHFLKPDGSRRLREECPIRAILETGSFYRTDDDVFVRKDGTSFYVSYVATPLMDGDEMVASVMAFHDITGRKEAERELKESQRQLRALSRFLQTVREEERAHIARELHDELGQALTALRIDVGWLQSRLGAAEPRMEEKLAAMADLVDRTVDSVRRISGDLRPGMLDDLGLAAAIEWLVEQFRTRHGITCALSMNREEFELSDPVATAVFRIVQEALTNVVRHAQAGQARVRVDELSDGIVVEISDDGRGIDEAPSGERKTYGLLGMRERVRMFNGSLGISSGPDRGTVVRAVIPFAHSGETL